MKKDEEEWVEEMTGLMYLPYISSWEMAVMKIKKGQQIKGKNIGKYLVGRAYFN